MKIDNQSLKKRKNLILLLSKQKWMHFEDLHKLQMKKNKIIDISFNMQSSSCLFMCTPSGSIDKENLFSKTRNV